MGMELIQKIEEGQKRTDALEFKVGDTVKVHFKIVEGKTERIQIYEGLVICFKNSGIGRTFTVRKNSYGVGVERVFPLHSPRARFAAPSSTTSGKRSARLPRSRPLSRKSIPKNKRKKTGQASGFFIGRAGQG